MTTSPFGHVRIPFKRIHLELTNVCDFNCLFCPKSLMTRGYGYMDEALARRAIDEISRKGLAEKITFHVMGEPTLHPKFFDILAYARDAGMPVGLTTNGGGLGGEAGKRLLDYELKQVDVSLQTPDEESFKLRRAGRLDFDGFLTGIVDFFAAYRERWPETIFKFRFLNTTFRPKSIEERQGPMRVISSTQELRDTFSAWVERIYELMDLGAEERRTALDRLRKLKSWKWNVVEILPNTFFETYMLGDWGNAFSDDAVREAWAGYCFGMRDHFAVLWNGDVVLCCIDFDGKTRVGSIADRSIEDVLKSPALGKVMAGFRRFRPVLPACRRCLGARSALSWLVKPFLQVGGLSLLKPYFHKKSRLFDDTKAAS
ncbi:Radical SAM domain protein [Desulfovibrio sp. X2]|uniref:radical SAM/SPASM domain-containing protein n=1 Tax=Desulfovibrio sp. X2 TaxID=941449 RepID=UPI000358A558|nr:radical SAM protein [Desulfovibrio sp. X2]EPR37542.1 Radical SAM domain protein [Desulfovibrio sp. X2]